MSKFVEKDKLQRVTRSFASGILARRLLRVCSIIALSLVFSPHSALVASDAVDSVTPPGLEKARNLLALLAGRWRFELTLVSEGSTRRLSGTRIFSAAHNPLALSWEEELDGPGVKILGVLGFDDSRNEWYEFALPNDGPGEFATGAWDDRGRVVFEHRADHEEAARLRTVLEKIDGNHIEFVRLRDSGGQFHEQWRAVFTRVPGEATERPEGASIP